MQQRLTKNQLLEILEGWNHILRRRVRMIACGGTAMTLLGVKASTKDVDFLVPNDKEYKYLTAKLMDIGYELQIGWQREGEPFRFDLFRGNKIHTTTLLDSPLERERHTLLFEYSHLYIGILNDYDLIASKLMRGTTVDFEDCIALTRARKDQLDLTRLVERFHRMVDLDISEERIRSNIDVFLERLNERGDSD